MVDSLPFQVCNGGIDMLHVSGKPLEFLIFVQEVDQKWPHKIEKFGECLLLNKVSHFNKRYLLVGKFS